MGAAADENPERQDPRPTHLELSEPVALEAGESVRTAISGEDGEDLTRLGLEEKRRLRRLLDEEIAQSEEELLEKDAAVREEIREARAAFAAGDCLTIDEIPDRRLRARRN